MCALNINETVPTSENAFNIDIFALRGENESKSPQEPPKDAYMRFYKLI